MALQCLPAVTTGMWNALVPALRGSDDGSRDDTTELECPALKGDGLLQTTMVSPRIRLHLVADSRRREWGAELLDKDTMAG